MNVHDVIHRAIVSRQAELSAWFARIRPELDLPIYSSFDIRDSGFKVTNVDGNIYPAGFNNICPVDKGYLGELMATYLERHYEGRVRRILLVTEEHTNNPYYWENVRSLAQVFRDAKVDVKVAVPRLKVAQQAMPTSSGGEVEVLRLEVEAGRLKGFDQSFDLVVSNNDFSDAYAEWGERLDFPLNPPRELGWYQREKSRYFEHYNQLCREFAEVVQIDPWLLTVRTEKFDQFDMFDDEARLRLEQTCERMFEELRSEYQRREIPGEPTLFIKNNAGTYGLAVMRIASPKEIRELNYKTRKKMKAAKGGRDVDEVIVQEGVPSIVSSEGSSAEPVIYLLGCQLAGGFLRTHSEKGPTESLNSPGAVYRRLCVSDLNVSIDGHPLENVYGWSAKLGLLAMGREAKEMGVVYQGYRRWAEGCTSGSGRGL